MKSAIRTFSTAAALAILGCSGELTGPRPSVTLTAAQASTLLDKALLIAGSDSGLAWLADSMDCVLKAGAEARLITVLRDGIERTFYAVGLVRQFAGANPFSTFHLIAFDLADNPSSFLLLNGYAAGSGGTPPSQATGTFGGGSVFAHMIHLSGTEVDGLVAEQGEAAFVLGDVGAGCASAMSVTCNVASLVVDFRIDVARPDNNPAEVHSVAQKHVIVPGILLVFN